MHALDRILDLLAATWDHVVVEGEEDISCSRRRGPKATRYEQIKTVEDPSKTWTPAMLTNGDAGDTNRSILGKLFRDKRLKADSEFRLTLNEGVAPSLTILTQAPAHRAGADADAIADLARRLRAMTPASNRDLVWCLQRLTISIASRSIDDLRHSLLRRISDASAAHCSGPLLPDEQDAVLATLMDWLAELASQPEAVIIDRDSIASQLCEAAEAVMRPVESPGRQNETLLRRKLRRAGLVGEQIEAAVREMLMHRRDLRSAPMQRKQALRDLTSEVFAACLSVDAQRKAGDIAGGAATYAATFAAIEALVPPDRRLDGGVARANAFRVVHDITSRCEHRYA